MTPTRTFAIDTDRIVHETIEDETIVIDLTTGTYFSLTGSGAQVWTWLIEGHSEQDVLATLADIAPKHADGVADFIRQLCDERLLEEAPTAPSTSGPREPLAPAGPLEPLGPPRLGRYSDMEHLLLLDPIHEVRAAGWPHAADAAPSGPGE